MLAQAVPLHLLGLAPSFFRLLSLSLSLSPYLSLCRLVLPGSLVKHDDDSNCKM